MRVTPEGGAQKGGTWGKCLARLPSNTPLGIPSTATEWIAVALLGQEHSRQPPRQEAQFRLWPAANCRHQKLTKNKDQWESD